MYPASDLTAGDSLPGGDEVARYCKPSDYDLEGRTPKVTAFMKRKDEVDVSVYRLQFFQGCSRDEAVDYIRQEFGACFERRQNGRFVVLNVSEVKATVKGKGFDTRIEYAPKPPRQQPPCPAQPSHCSILDLPADVEEETKVATAIMRLIKESDTYLAVTPE